MSHYNELLMAIERSSLSKIEEILNNPEIDVKELLTTEDALKYTPIFSACLHKNEVFGEQVVSLFLKKGADPKHLDNHKQNVLYYLAKDGTPLVK